MVFDRLPVFFAGIGSRANEIDIRIMTAVQLKVCRIFAEYSSNVGGIDIRHDEVHRANVTRAFFYYVDTASDRGKHVTLLESLNVVEYLLCANSTCFTNSNTLQLAVEYKHVSSIEKGHIVLDTDAFISKCASCVRQKQCRFAEAGQVILPYGSDVVMELPFAVAKPGSAPAMALVFGAVPGYIGELFEMVLDDDGHTGPDVKQATHEAQPGANRAPAPEKRLLGNSYRSVWPEA